MPRADYERDEVSRMLDDYVDAATNPGIPANRGIDSAAAEERLSEIAARCLDEPGLLQSFLAVASGERPTSKDQSIVSKDRVIASVIAACCAGKGSIEESEAVEWWSVNIMSYVNFDPYGCLDLFFLSSPRFRFLLDGFFPGERTKLEKEMLRVYPKILSRYAILESRDAVKRAVAALGCDGVPQLELARVIIDNGHELMLEAVRKIKAGIHEYLAPNRSYSRPMLDEIRGPHPREDVEMALKALASASSVAGLSEAYSEISQPGEPKLTYLDKLIYAWRTGVGILGGELEVPQEAKQFAGRVLFSDMANPRLKEWAKWLLPMLSKNCPGQIMALRPSTAGVNALNMK